MQMCRKYKPTFPQWADDPVQDLRRLKWRQDAAG